jgi:hypothetical protein
MASGYSGTPLMKKLGISEKTLVLILNQPPEYGELLGTDFSSQLVKKSQSPDLVHLFARNRKEMEKELLGLKPVLKANPDLVIWVSWYKKSAGIPTDLTENHIREYALAHGLVDIKVCAVSELWSGLKLVVPKKLR